MTTVASGSKRTKRYVKWSEDKSEVYKPHYKVIFPGKRVVYCGQRDLGVVTMKSKEISEGASKFVDDEPPYKVSFPGQDDLKLTKDPRLGAAQAKRNYIFTKFGINDDSDYSTKEMRRDHYSAKRTKQAFRQRYNDSVANEARNLKNRDCKCAETAIRFYNEKHATDYEIVETLGSYSRIYAGVYFHCNFRALRKSDADSGRPSKPKLFFAELFRKKPLTLEVNVCKMLDGPGPRPDIIRGCKICPGQLWHPVGGFKNGK